VCSSALEWPKGRRLDHQHLKHRSDPPGSGHLPYSAGKAGLNTMTIAFAHTYGPKVRVNCIMPGGFLTDVTESWDWDAFNESAKRFALQRIGEPEEIVGTLLYLASDASSFTTGAVFPIDGGVPT
jgi:NAD(P)-dependent dehydrogenase (short-subunit alcohol dehydrogenase family)